MRNRGRYLCRNDVYFIVDAVPHAAGRAGACACGHQWKKGDTVERATFAHETHGFVLRHRLYCCNVCVPTSIQSGTRDQSGTKGSATLQMNEPLATLPTRARLTCAEHGLTTPEKILAAVKSGSLFSGMSRRYHKGAHADLLEWLEQNHPSK